MTQLRSLSIALVLSLLAPTVALAQQPAEVRVEEFTDGDQVTGTYQSPDGARTTIYVRGPRASLIRARTSFRPELLKSVEDL